MLTELEKLKLEYSQRTLEAIIDKLNPESLTRTNLLSCVDWADDVTRKLIKANIQA